MGLYAVWCIYNELTDFEDVENAYWYVYWVMDHGID